MNPDLTNKTAVVRSAAATHSGGLTAGLSPLAQWATLQTTGDTPLPPVFTAIEPSPSGTNVLLMFIADPGAYFTMRTSTNLVNWSDTGSVLAESDTNAVTLTSSDAARFWRLRRGQ